MQIYKGIVKQGQKSCRDIVRQLISGEHGIRTHGPLRDTAFREPHLKPLGQLSVLKFFPILLENLF